MLFKKVLVSIDFSDASRLLICCLDEFKRFGLKEITLVHIVDVSSAGGSATSFMESNKKRLKEIGSELGKNGFNVKTVIKTGFPAREIENVASEEKASLILIGSHGGGFIKSFFLGSTAFDLLRITNHPVLIEKFRKKDKVLEPYCPIKFLKVLVATDFSECSENLIKVIKENKSIFNEIFLVNVIEKASNLKDLEKIKNEADKNLNKIKDLLKGIATVKTAIRQGSASKNIIEASIESNSSLIMLTRKGQGRIKDILIGSTAEEVAKYSKIPVILMPC